MVAGLRPILPAALLLASCAGGEKIPPRVAEPPEGQVFEITGKYDYIDGDRLFPRGCNDFACSESLERDDRLQQNVVKFQGRTFALRVKRVRCTRDIMTVACVRSGNGTKLSIQAWIRPKPRPTH